jgi:hypothetical protein
MSTQVQPQSLQERVERARADQEQERAEVTARKAQKARERLKAKMLSVLNIHVEESDITVLGAGPFVTVEGFDFTLDLEGTLAHLRKCDACGEHYSRLVYSVSSLADTFIPYPHNDAFCLKLAAQPEEPKTTEEKLLQALRDYIAEHSYQG